MRFLSFLLAGLLAVSAADAAQRVPREQKLTLPQGQSKRNTIKPQLTPNVTPRVCPKSTQGIWPNCTRTGSRKCPKGTTGKWPDCKNIARHCPQARRASGPIARPSFGSVLRARWGNGPVAATSPWRVAPRRGWSDSGPTAASPSLGAAPMAPPAHGRIAARSSRTAAPAGRRVRPVRSARARFAPP